MFSGSNTARVVVHPRAHTHTHEHFGADVGWGWVRWGHGYVRVRNAEALNSVMLSIFSGFIRPRALDAV